MRDINFYEIQYEGEITSGGKHKKFTEYKTLGIYSEG